MFGNGTIPSHDVDGRFETTAPFWSMHSEHLYKDGVIVLPSEDTSHDRTTLPVSKFKEYFTPMPKFHGLTNAFHETSPDSGEETYVAIPYPLYSKKAAVDCRMYELKKDKLAQMKFPSYKSQLCVAKIRIYPFENARTAFNIYCAFYHPVSSSMQTLSLTTVFEYLSGCPYFGDITHQLTSTRL